MAERFTREQLIAATEMLAIGSLLDSIDYENPGMCRGAQSVLDIVELATAKRLIWLTDGRVEPMPADPVAVQGYLDDLLKSGITDRIEAIDRPNCEIVKTPRQRTH